MTARIVDFLLHDAGRLDALLDEARSLAADGFLGAARQTFALLERRLDRHLRLEEHVVLPRLDDADGRPAATMRPDHERLRQLLEEAAGALAAGDGAGFVDAADRLIIANLHHARKERRLYSPARALI